MKSLLNIFQIWYREIGNIIRDKGILIFILFVPLAYPLLYSYVYTNEVVRDVPVAVVDENNSALSRDILRKMDASPDMKIASLCDNMEQAREMVKRREVYGIVRIPESFTRELAEGRQTPIGLYCDMSSMLYYKALLVTATNVSLEVNKNIKVNNYVTGTTDREDEIHKTPIDYDYVALYNPQSGFAAFLIPPVLMLIIQQTLLLGIGMSAGNSRERHGGSVIPFHPWYKNPVHIVIGKALPYFMLYVILAVYMFTAVTDLFTLPKLGHYWTFIAFIVPYLLACIFLAMTISAFIYRREDSILLLVFLSVPMLFLSGLSWPSASMSSVWKYVSYIFPSTFGMNGYVRIASMGASLSDIKTEYMALWIQAGIYFLLALWFYRSQIMKLVRRGRKKLDPSPDIVLKNNGRNYHVNVKYSNLTDCITSVPDHDYEVSHVFCNHRNTVELVTFEGKDYVVKKFKRPTWANCVIYTFFRKNKAERAYNHALVLDSLGVDTPTPVAYITQKRYRLFHTAWFISEYRPYVSLSTILDCSDYESIRAMIMEEFIRFTLSIHNKGIRHKDYNPGNILVHFHNGKAKPMFTLIDINQMAIGRKPGIKKSVISFMQNRMRMKEEILPMVRYYSNLRKIPYRLCRMACFRYYILREVQRFLKKPVKALVLAVAR